MAVCCEKQCCFQLNWFYDIGLSFHVFETAYYYSTSFTTLSVLILLLPLINSWETSLFQYEIEFGRRGKGKGWSDTRRNLVYKTLLYSQTLKMKTKRNSMERSTKINKTESYYRKVEIGFKLNKFFETRSHLSFNCCSVIRKFSIFTSLKIFVRGVRGKQNSSRNSLLIFYPRWEGRNELRFNLIFYSFDSNDEFFSIRLIRENSVNFSWGVLFFQVSLFV